MVRRLVLPLALLTAGCATTGSTLGSGVGDTYLEHPPYYAGARLPVAAVAPSTLGHLPVTFQAVTEHSTAFDPSKLPALDSLLVDMNRYLDSLGVSKRLVDGGAVSAVAHAATRRGPDVRFGCQTEGGAAWADCMERDEGALGRSGQRMLLAVGRPSSEWTAWAAEVMGEGQVGHALVITLEVGQYWARQRGWRGDKEVELGTSYTLDLPWLTSLETPVQVLQLTGALVGPDGKAVRIGAEGLLARRTRILLSAIGVQELVRAEDVHQLRTARREDVPGKPLLWQAGLRQIVSQLTGLDAR